MGRVGRVGWLRALSFGRDWALNRNCATCQRQQQHRRDEFARQTGHLAILEAGNANQALVCCHPLTATGTGGPVMDHGAARSDSRCCLLHPGELVIGRVTWYLPTYLPSVEPVWQLGICLWCPKAPKILEAGRWLWSPLYMRRNNLK